MSKIGSLRLATLIKDKETSDKIKAKESKATVKPYARRVKVKNDKPYKSSFQPYMGKGLEYFIQTADATQPLKKKIKKTTTSIRQTSLGERLVADWLVKNGIRFKREKEFLDLINPLTGKRLIVDFYLHAHKMVIEFDGRQHYKASKMFDRNGDSLEARKQRDGLKNNYCIDKCLTMIRIKYSDINRINEILSPLLKNTSL